MAVGASPSGTFTEMMSGSTWKVEKSPNPKGAGHDAVLVGVSCAGEQVRGGRLRHGQRQRHDVQPDRVLERLAGGRSRARNPEISPDLSVSEGSSQIGLEPSVCNVQSTRILFV